MMSDAWFRQKRPPLWISPRILRKYYADFLLPDTVQNKQQQIFRAVIDASGRSIRGAFSQRRRPPH
jgi:hypothetical protein